ncbi:MAG: amidohydrolase [Opitutus sp.]|nr:amidohydrolase [Opitutus sp.]
MLRVTLLASALAISAAAQPADLLLVNGNIHTLDAAQPRATAIAVRGDRIVFVGDAAGAEQFRAGAKRVIDLHGATVVPGLNDAHMHLEGVGERELSFDLEGTKSVTDLQAKVAARVASAPAKKWIVGRGWIETHWPEKRFPARQDLDAVAPQHPVVLVRADGHALVANSLALRLGGVTRDTPAPSGGEILHDAQGEPTGMLIDQAMTLAMRLVPPSTPEEVEQFLVVGAAREARLGWTGVQNAGNSFEDSERLRRLIADGRVKIRVYDSLSGADGSGVKLLAAGPVIGESAGRFTRRGVKLYIDGALGSRGAALLAPYADYPQSSGLLMQEEAKLMPFLTDALRQGIQIQTHAIGDRGNRSVLDWYEKALAAVPVAERGVAQPRWRIEHAQIIHPTDIPRFAQLGVIASMQPSHAIGDLFFAPSRLGKDRLACAYAWQSLLKSGAVIASGSDAPVERGEPMIEFYAAVARRSLDGFANEDWHLEQRMTREQALRAMTLDAAFATFEEKQRGSIEVGKWADFTVLSADILKIPEPEILKTRCLYTIVGGEVVHEAK